HVRVVADVSVPDSPNLVAGANEPGRHLRNVNYGRDWEAHAVADIALAEAGHRCARCNSAEGGTPEGGGGTLTLARGIEMGHVFRLGRTYTEPLEVRVLDADGKQVTPIMGC